MFVAANIVVLVVKSLRQGTPPVMDDDSCDRLVVYYFHGHVRCPPCEHIEAYAHEAVTGSFAERGRRRPDRVEGGRFRGAGQEHFAREFELIATTVVLVEMRDGSPKRWKNLQEVWEMVRR